MSFAPAKWQRQTDVWNSNQKTRVGDFHGHFGWSVATTADESPLESNDFCWLPFHQGWNPYFNFHLVYRIQLKIDQFGHSILVKVNSFSYKTGFYWIASSTANSVYPILTKRPKRLFFWIDFLYRLIPETKNYKFLKVILNPQNLLLVTLLFLEKLISNTYHSNPGLGFHTC